MNGREPNGQFKKGESGNSNGRPKIDIDYDLVAKLAQIQCTVAEMAAILNLSISKLKADSLFMAIHKKGLEDGKRSLRRLQWDKAKGIEGVLARDDDGKLLFNDKGHAIVLTPGAPPDTAMQIWLGKQYLGQKEPKAEMELSGNADKPVTLKVVYDDGDKR
jgi:hypothetical protein